MTEHTLVTCDMWHATCYYMLVTSLSWGRDENVSSFEQASPIGSLPTPLTTLLLLSPQRFNMHTHPRKPQKRSLLPERQMEEELPDRSIDISLVSQHKCKLLKEAVPHRPCKLTTPKQQSKSLHLLTKNTRKWTYYRRHLSQKLIHSVHMTK